MAASRECGICFLAFAGFTLAQAPPAATNRSITLNVVVTAKSGKPVSGLQQQDFTVLENNHPQKILSFEAVAGANPNSGPPVNVILLLDGVNTEFSRVAFARLQVEKFLQRDNGVLSRPVALGFLNDVSVKFTNFSQDGNALIAELNANQAGLRSIGRNQGVYGAGDRLTLSLRALEQLTAAAVAQPGRKLVIWVSPGWPILTGPRIELSSQDQRKLFGEIVNLSNALRNSGITIYSVDPLGTADAVQGRTIYYEEFLKGVKKPQQVQYGNIALQVLAVQTGGRVFNSENDIVAEIAGAMAEANDFYVLTYEGAPGDGPNDYHSIEVKVDQPGLKAHTRTGYYAQP
jgi:VWFA-related protein